MKPRTYGTRPHTVRVFMRAGRVCCQWRVGKVRKTKGWADSPEARKAAREWAEDYAAERRRLGAKVAPGPLTLAHLWAKYQVACASTWRPKTRDNYADYYHILADTFGGGKVVGEITMDNVDGFKVRRREQGIAHSQVRRQIGFLRQLVNWAEGRELVGRNRLRAYRYVVAKEERGVLPDEYRREDLVKMAAQLASPRHWRPRCIVTLCGSLGARINSVLHLRWGDVDLEAGTVRWAPEYDKLGKERVQPLTAKARAALVEALGQRHETEPWVFWAVRHRNVPFHYNAVYFHLREAEKAAGVRHLPGRAFHGLRRMVVGDVGDLRDAAAWVGQASLKVTATYDRARAEQVQRAKAAVEGKEGVA